MHKFSKHIILLSIVYCLLSAFVFNAYVTLADNTPILQSDSEIQYTQVQTNTGKTDCIETGDCQLNDMVKVIIKVANWILGIVGSLALLAFIYGGVMFLISGGSSERVAKAKTIIVGSVIGITIVLTSYMIINFAAQALGVIKPGESILRTGWFGN
jgi:hypothetical protein